LQFAVREGRKVRALLLFADDLSGDAGSRTVVVSSTLAGASRVCAHCGVGLLGIVRAQLMVLCFFSMLYPERDTPENRSALVKDPLEKCGSTIKIAHGECTGMAGMYGSQQRSQYCVFIPRYPDILRKLFAAHSARRSSLTEGK
jgi:hypothetical protein